MEGTPDPNPRADPSPSQNPLLLHAARFNHATPVKRNPNISFGLKEKKSRRGSCFYLKLILAPPNMEVGNWAFSTPIYEQECPLPKHLCGSADRNLIVRHRNGTGGKFGLSLKKARERASMLSKADPHPLEPTRSHCKTMDKVSM